ncbi:unnamed protein product [Rhizoctonia solani]|uniref:Transmembrane protein n=1 Tax=Rhizoctonia solani TaxID=456999 RepID=A0A8H3DMW5_9AGAM|nr:unnamed protein product [Rhizoctonia solani]
MTMFGRRVAPSRLLGILVLLMSTATSRAGEPIACKYNETAGWSQFGAEGKDVCNVAQTLMNNTCQSGMPILDTSTMRLEDVWYTASEFKSANAKRCACDRVMFNLLSACAGCQKWDWQNVTTHNMTWQAFHTYQDGECPNGDLQKRGVEWNSPAPAWAKDFRENSFNPIRAQSVIPAQTTDASPSSASQAAETSPAVTDDVSQATASSSGPPIGAIVGGVIGGLIFLGAIAGLVYWLHCRKRRARDVAPSSEFLKREYFMEQPPLLPAHERRQSTYQDEIEEERRPTPAHRRSWVGGFATTRRHEDDEDDDSEMLPPFTRGTYIGPSPHEKGHPERRDTGDTDLTVHTDNTTTFFLSSASPPKRSGPSDYHT